MTGKVVGRDFWGVRVIITEEISPSCEKRSYSSVGGVERLLIIPAGAVNQGKGEKIRFQAVRRGEQTLKLKSGVEKRLERWVYCGEYANRELKVESPSPDHSAKGHQPNL